MERIGRAEESEQNPDEQLAMTKIYPRRNLRGRSWRKKHGVKLLLKEKSMRALAVIPGPCSLSNMLSSRRQEFHQKMNVPLDVNQITQWICTPEEKGQFSIHANKWKDAKDVREILLIFFFYCTFFFTALFFVLEVMRFTPGCCYASQKESKKTFFTACSWWIYSYILSGLFFHS